MGAAGYSIKPAEEANLKYRRSIYVVEDIKAGELITEGNVRRIRPGFGLPPKYFEEVLGKNAKVDIERGTALQWKHLVR
jgi:sialic acid synthase SpsE